MLSYNVICPSRPRFFFRLVSPSSTLTTRSHSVCHITEYPSALLRRPTFTLLSKNSQISLYSSVHGNGEGSRGHLTPLEFHTLQPTKKTSYLFFLDALRERVINDICEHSQSLGTVARRLDNGIIWGLPGSCKDWGTGWEHHAHYR